jgi:hypothetical protein
MVPENASFLSEEEIEQAEEIIKEKIEQVE